MQNDDFWHGQTVDDVAAKLHQDPTEGLLISLVVGLEKPWRHRQKEANLPMTAVAQLQS